MRNNNQCKSFCIQVRYSTTTLRMDPASMKPLLRERQGMTTLTRVNSYSPLSHILTRVNSYSPLSHILTRVNSYTPLSHILAYITKLTYIETVVLVNFSLIPQKVFIKLDLLNFRIRKGSVTWLAIFADILVLFF